MEPKLTPKLGRPVRYCKKWKIGKRPRVELTQEQKDRRNRKARRRYKRARKAAGETYRRRKKKKVAAD